MKRSAEPWFACLVAAPLGVWLIACSVTPPTPPSSTGPDGTAPITSSGQPTATASLRTRSASSSAVPLAAAPTGCPGPEPRARSVADFVGPVVLGPPLWAGIYATYEQATNAYSALDAPLTEHGWRIKILFLLEPRHESAVELVGDGVEPTDAGVRFAVEGATPAALATFDPDEPGIPVQNEGWREYPTYAYFPGAGCYRLTATWSEGVSAIGFGFGG